MGEKKVEINEEENDILLSPVDDDSPAGTSPRSPSPIKQQFEAEHTMKPSNERKNVLNMHHLASHMSQPERNPHAVKNEIVKDAQFRMMQEAILFRENKARELD